MSKLEKYSTYKNSGIEWLGDIPEHWEILPSKRFHSNIKEFNTRKSCNNVLSLTLRGVVNNNIDSPEGLVPKDYSTYQIFEKNDLVFKLIDLENISTSRVGLVHEKGIMSSAYIRIKVEKYSLSKYAYYYYFNLYLNQVYNNLGSGVRSTLGITDLLNMPYIKPIYSEQQKIVTFLDIKTKQLDKAIKQKEQLIKLLKERRQILINDAVTKGIDKTVSMKNSGVEWIGEIPEGWEVKKLKYISKIVLGKMVCNSKIGNMELKPYLKSKNIQWLYVDIKSVDAMWFTKKEMRDYRLKTDDIILSEGGEVGKTCIWNNELPECYIQNSAHKVTINSLYTPHYYLYLFNNIGHKGVFDAIVNKVSIGHLTKDKLSNITILLPSQIEQQQIVKHIEKNNQKIDKAIDIQQQQVTKLKEYKITLIDSVVTGKVRVV
jgi:type I restriction enzyme S subunit